MFIYFIETQKKQLDNKLQESVIRPVILFSAIPDMQKEQMLLLHKKLFFELGPFLSAKQQEYAGYCGLTPASLKMAVARCIARKLAVFFMPHIYIYSNNNNRPACKNFFLCFSYSGSACVCIISAKCKAAIDAEMKNTEIPGFDHFFYKLYAEQMPECSNSAKLRAWLLFEAIFKLTGCCNIAKEALDSFICNKICSTKKICWQFIPFNEHWLCTAFLAKKTNKPYILNVPWQNLVL